MDEMMTFPDTWEEFEKSYGFTDNEEVYTNGARLIPSFRVKQWLDHLPSVTPTHSNSSNTLGALDCVDRAEVIKAVKFYETFCDPYPRVIEALEELPSAQPEEVIPHRNYKYLSDFWCECGNHLGKKGDVKYCSDCGKRVKWDE